MINIQAEELIYTRVEAPYSSRNMAGFQTFYRSKSLSENDVRFIERRVQCFQPFSSETKRHQFFRLNDEKIVLTHTVQIDPHPEIIDSSSRRGAFISHCIILDKINFNNIKQNPFIIFDNYEFVTDAITMVDKYGQLPRIEYSSEIEIHDTHEFSDCSWKGDDLKKLLFLGFQAKNLVNEQKLVFFIGDETKIIETLRNIMDFLPENQRKFCSFDSCIDRCSVQIGTYWAIGSTKKQTGASYIQVDATENRIISKIKEDSEKQDLYWKWLNAVAETESLSTVLIQAPTIQLLNEAFKAKNEINVKELNRDAFKIFLKMFGDQVAANLKMTLTPVIGQKLSDLLIDYIHQIEKIPDLINIAFSQVIDYGLLSHYITSFIFNQKHISDDIDWKILQNVAKQGEHTILLFLSAFLKRKPDIKIRDEALLKMNENEFSEILKFLMNPIDPLHFVTPNHLELLVKNKQLENIKGEQLFELAKAIIDIYSPEHLNSLVKYVGKLDHKAIKNLQKLLKKHHEIIPKDFYEAVQQRRIEIGESSRIFFFFHK